MFKNILLAADGSDHSIRAAESALHIASKESRVVVVYVIDPASSKADVLHSKSSSERDIKRQEKIKPVIELLDLSRNKYEIVQLRGEPGPTIVDYANKNDFDCVVIGSRGLNRLQSMVLGSVSHKVAKRVDCPVLIVK